MLLEETADAPLHACAHDDLLLRQLLTRRQSQRLSAARHMKPPPSGASAAASAASVASVPTCAGPHLPVSMQANSSTLPELAKAIFSNLPAVTGPSVHAAVPELPGRQCPCKASARRPVCKHINASHSLPPQPAPTSDKQVRVGQARRKRRCPPGACALPATRRPASAGR